MFSAAILAGGLATRLRPLTERTPKSLLRINGEPFIAHQLRLLKKNDIDHVVLCVGFLGEMIKDTVRDGARFGLRIDYSFDGEHMMGTGGAIKKALPSLGDAFFVFYGDSYLPCNYKDIEERFSAAGTLALMTVFKNSGLWDVSNAEFSNGCLVSYDKKTPSPRMQHIDYGVGIFKKAAFAGVPSDRPSDLADVYRDLLVCGELTGYEIFQRFYEIGSVKGLKEMEEYLRGEATR